MWPGNHFAHPALVVTTIGNRMYFLGELCALCGQ